MGLWNWLNGRKTAIATVLVALLLELEKNGVALPAWVHAIVDGLLALGILHKGVKSLPNAVKGLGALILVGGLCTMTLGLTACSTAQNEQPAVQTIPTTAKQAAGQGEIRLSMAGWNSAASIDEKARLGDEQTRNNARSTIKVPLRDADGKPVLNPAGNLVYVEYEGGPIRDLYVVTAGEVGIDASQRPQIGGTTTGTEQGVAGSGTQDKRDASDQKPTNDVKVDAKVPVGGLDAGGAGGTLPPVPPVPPAPAGGTE